MPTVVIDAGELRALIEEVVDASVRAALAGRKRAGSKVLLTQQAMDADDEWLTMSEAMALTKFRDHMTLSRYAHAGLLPEGCATRIGKKWRFHRGLLIAWMRERSG